MPPRPASLSRTGEWVCPGRLCPIDRLWVTLQQGVVPAAVQAMRCPECGRTIRFLREVYPGREPRNGAV
jgi:hypothetical protein